VIIIKYNKKFIESLFKAWLQKRSFRLKQCIEECKSNSILRKEKNVLKRNFSLLYRASKEFGNSSGRYLTELALSNNGNTLSASVISSYYIFDHAFVRNKKELKVTLILNIKTGRFNTRVNKQKEVGLIGVGSANKEFLIKNMNKLYQDNLDEEKKGEEEKKPGSGYIKCW